MKLSLILAGAASAAAFVACATTQDSSPEVTLPAEAGLPPADAASVDGGKGAPADAEAGLPACSPDGFCPTDVPSDQTLQGVWGDGAGVVWAVSAQGAVLRFDGAAWKVHASLAGALSAVWGSGPTDVWIGGAKGLYHGTGASSAALVFTATAAPGAADLGITSVWGTGPSDVWAVGGLPPDRDVFPYAPARARVLHLTSSGDAGAPWTLDAVSTKPIGISQVWGSKQAGVWLAGPRPMVADDSADETVVLRKAPGAPAFTEVALPHDASQALSAPYDVLAKLVHGTMSGDSMMWITGHTWFEQPGYLHGASTDNGATFTFTYSDALITDPTLNAITGVSATEAWAVGDYGRVRHWTPADPSWSQAAITRSAFPITAPFYAAWASGDDLWVVGDGIALHKDPNATKAGDP